jgi:hypothetical protein
LKGKENGRWEGGIKELYYDLRDHLQEWKESSMKVCNYRCILTGESFDEIHHLYPFKDIVVEVFQTLKLDMRKTIGEYNDEEVILIYKTLLEIHNKYPLGACLCKDLHKLFHDEFGYYHNMPNQFEEFKNNYFDGKYDYLLEDEFKSINSKINCKRVS